MKKRNNRTKHILFLATFLAITLQYGFSEKSEINLQGKGSSLKDAVSYEDYSCANIINFGSTMEVKEIEIYYDHTEASIVFAAQDLKSVLGTKGIDVSLKKLSAMPSDSQTGKIVIAKDGKWVRKALQSEGGASIGELEEQGYAIRTTGKGTQKSYWVIGGDRVGAMYGGIHLEEIINAFGVDAINNTEKSPYIARRGIKFNIPLGERQPSLDDRGTSPQENVVYMWDLSFWKEYLDVLARQRYNVLSLWNKHPFPSMIKLKDYPDVALNDVYNKSGKVNSMTIDQKIDMWKKVMDYAYDGG